MKFLRCSGLMAILAQAGCERNVSPTEPNDAVASLAMVVTTAAPPTAPESGGAASTGPVGSVLPVMPPGGSASTSRQENALAPYAELLPSLNATPELIVNLAVGAAYAPYVTEEWLYFTGATAGGSGVLRTKKEPEAAVEVVSTEFITNQANFYAEDGMVYFLADKVLMRWPEDSPELLERFELPMAHYRFKGDGDHFFAITYSSQDVTLFDKQTLEPHTIHLEDLTTGGGGAFDVASDGNKLYCTRLDVPGHLYVVDKVTEQVTRVDARLDVTPDLPLGLGYFYVEDGSLYGNLYSTGYFISIDGESGRTIGLASPPETWNSLIAEKEKDTPFMYFAAQFPDNVYRFDTKQYTVQRLLPDGYPTHLTYGLTMDATHVYFLTDVTYHDALNGILRVKKR